MEIKCKNYPKCSTTYLPKERLRQTPNPVRVYCPSMGNGARINKAAIERPITVNNVIGLSAIKRGFSKVISPIKSVVKTYKKNIEHTYEHKIYFSLVEKNLFGKNTVDSATHDIDKMILYLLGFPRSFVSPFHKKHSTHQVESGKPLNLRTMFIDNLVSSPELKPEKKLSLREHFNTCPQLQQISGFRELLEKYNYGEDLDFEQIKRLKALKLKGSKGFRKNLIKLLSLLLIH